MTKKLRWTPDTIEAFWSGISGSRLDELSFAKLNGEKLLNLVSPWLKNDATVLDFGAGSGFLVRLLLERGYRVAAFDPSGGRESALSASAQGLENFLGLEHGREQNTYDVVIFSEVIEHILDDDYQNVLTRVSGFLKEGGMLIVTTPNAEDIEQSTAFCPECHHFYHPWQHVRSIHPESLVEQFSKLGFTKQFLSLVDFSNDAEIIEFGKITQRLFADFDNLKEDSNSSASKMLDSQASATKKVNGFLAGLFMNVRNNDIDLKATQDEERLKQLQQKMLVDISNAQRRLSTLKRANLSQQFVAEGELIDLCLGNMSTIVYVGKKSKTGSGTEKI